MNEDKQEKPPGMGARIGLWAGPIWVVATLLLPSPGDMSQEAWRCAGLALLMGTWWATQALPLAITALLPIFMAPALGIAELDDAVPAYADPVIFLFLGGFLLGLSMQRWDLHKRIALRIMLIMGQNPRRQIAGFMMATGFLSMWVSNTATAVMMLPIATSVMSLHGHTDSEGTRRYGTALLLAIAYSASIGGVATLIGTPPNALLAGYLSSQTDMQIGFAQWMSVGLPVAIVMMLITWWWLTRGDISTGEEDSEKGQNLLKQEMQKLGALSSAEKRVGIIFMLAAIGWITRPQLNALGLGWLDDTTIAIMIGTLLFLVPSGTTGGRLMTWEVACKMPWDVLILFGGGLAMAGIVQDTGLAEWIAEQLTLLSVLPTLLLIGCIVLIIKFLTEITSNTATAATFLPLLAATAVSLEMPPLLILVPATISAACAFMMPIATPPNAIVFASGQLRITDMIRKGLFLNLVSTLVITGLCYVVVTFLW
ncbi:SLC13 family permease [Kushneria sp. TE3]|uniref:SLC13 family permease n=1 Tax=Kushneria sp. TE3 TaxID=3449832 RepID=UPI003F687D69